MNNPELRYLKFVEKLVALLLFSYPILLLTVKGGMNGSFILLLILSIYSLLSTERASFRTAWNNDIALYVFAMVSLPAAIFFSQSYHQHYSGHPYDAASRFLLVVPIFMFLRYVRFDILAIVQYAFPLGAIAGLLISREAGSVDLGNVRLTSYFLEHIQFGDFALMLGALSILSINWVGIDPIFLRLLKLLGLLAGCYASIRSGARGGWVAVPVFLVMALYFRVEKVTWKSLLAILFFVFALSVVAYEFNQQIHHRVDMVFSDFVALQQGNSDTSIGVRLQLWKAAILIFEQNPIFGVGPEGFRLSMAAMMQSGILTPGAAEMGRAEVHNEILSKTAELGLFGLIAILLIYFVPFRLFVQAAHSDLPRVKHSGLLGVAFVSGFFVFGLTVEIFNLTLAAAFYSLTVAVLLAACFNVHHERE